MVKFPNGIFCLGFQGPWVLELIIISLRVDEVLGKMMEWSWIMSGVVMRLWLKLKGGGGCG